MDSERKARAHNAQPFSDAELAEFHERFADYDFFNSELPAIPPALPVPDQLDEWPDDPDGST